jgi:hypothetical protein
MKDRQNKKKNTGPGAGNIEFGKIAIANKSQTIDQSQSTEEKKYD